MAAIPFADLGVIGGSDVRKGLAESGQAFAGFSSRENETRLTE